MPVAYAVTDKFRRQAEQAARLLGLQMPPERLESVGAQLALLSRHAAVVLALELAPEVEPATVFVP